MTTPIDDAIVPLVRRGFDELTRLACANQAGDEGTANIALRNLARISEEAGDLVGAARARRRAEGRRAVQEHRAGLTVHEGGKL